MVSADEESDLQRQEREIKEKQDADVGGLPLPPRPITEQNFMQYMYTVEEGRRQDQERQNKFLQDLMETQAGRARGEAVRGVTLSNFQDAKPVPFARAIEPMEAEDWIADTERKLKTVGCSEEEKVRYATHLLTGPAASWWEATVATLPAGHVVTWEEFMKKFREAHVPESIMELKRREFENLRQNDVPVGRYITAFNTLSRYALDEVDTDEKRKKRFMKGLNSFMKMQLRLAKPK